MSKSGSKGKHVCKICGSRMPHMPFGPDSCEFDNKSYERKQTFSNYIRELEQQRNAALKLAKELRHQKAHTYASENADLYRGFDNGCEYAGRRIEAIFAQKCK